MMQMRPSWDLVASFEDPVAGAQVWLSWTPESVQGFLACPHPCSLLTHMLYWGFLP